MAAWISQRLGRRVGRQLGWAYLRRLGARLLVPRPRHVHADPHAQADFKQQLRPLLRAVATAFPQATVELWAVDEHRIGLKPILRKVWTLAGQRPIAPVEQRYAWRYVLLADTNSDTSADRQERTTANSTTSQSSDYSATAHADGRT